MNDKSVVIIGAGTNDLVESDAISFGRPVHFMGVA